MANYVLPDKNITLILMVSFELLSHPNDVTPFETWSVGLNSLGSWGAILSKLKVGSSIAKQPLY